MKINTKYKLLVLLFLFITSIESYSQEKTTIEQIIEDNKGKVIYIDFWASWCKPCRKEIKNMPYIYSIYKDKDIVFIYISIEIDEKKWLEASTKESLNNEKYNLLILKMKRTPDFKLSTKFDLSIKASIPQYIIFNKKGELVNSDAPRPSEKQKLIAEFDKYLKE